MKIAIIGSGISGLGAAYLLHKDHDITVYEKEGYIGGHSRTIDVDTSDGKIAVDTGFIVFNHRNYPHLTALFKELDVPTVKSDMSFGVSINEGWLEYGTKHLSNVFAQKRNVFRKDFHHMIKDILRFNKEAQPFIQKNPKASMEQCVEALGMRDWFVRYYILAMGGAIWSTPLSQMLQFPAATMVQFFENHGLLSTSGQPQWYTVEGGSREYVQRLVHGFRDKILLNCSVKKVERQGTHVLLTDQNNQTVQYDQVVFACHSDQALKIIENPHQIEQEVLGNIRYQPNRVVVHRDTSFMPKRRKAWSSWVYLSESRTDKEPAVALSYWMNNLQSLPTKDPIIVTLNPTREPDAKLIDNEHIFHHPVFDQSAILAQNRIDDIQGTHNLWFCGAWQRYGFHEDGLLSAVQMSKKLGATIPWEA